MDNKTSVKVHNPPGGQSNFSLSHEPEVAKTSVKVNQQPGGTSNIQFGTNNIEPAQQAKTSVRIHQQAPTHNNIFGGYDQPAQQPQQRRNPNQTSGNIFGGAEEPPKVKQQPQQQQQNQPVDQASQPAKTSVKVHNPPGGRSNFTLG